MIGRVHGFSFVPVNPHDECLTSNALQIKMKVDKTKEDKVAEANRSELLRFLNSSYD